MTDYIAITEAETNPGAPSKSSLWKRWAKNWIAGFEGAPGAPRLQVGAMGSWFTTAGGVGTLAFLSERTPSMTPIVAGTDYAGSGLGYAGLGSGGSVDYGPALTGTWRALGAYTKPSSRAGTTLFIRVA